MQVSYLARKTVYCREWDFAKKVYNKSNAKHCNSNWLLWLKLKKIYKQNKKPRRSFEKGSRITPYVFLNPRIPSLKLLTIYNMPQ